MSIQKRMGEAQRKQEPLYDLPKHQKYKNYYKRGDLFWGLGVEHETYIKTSQETTFTSFKGYMEPERYSVSYYKAYKEEELLPVLEKVIGVGGGKLKVPILMNSHSFTHTDRFNIHKTTFEKQPKPNPKAESKSFFDWACNYSKWLSSNYDKSFMWDGDSIEFITQNFYKANVKGVLDELRCVHSSFIDEMNRLPKQGMLIAYGPLTLAYPKNEPFASYLTNLKNISMFNNGTIHINITLPTRLSWFKKQKPANWEKFVEKHRRLARLIQWLEPLFIAVYGSSDPLHLYSSKFASASSQRLAVSRYIGLGTFDTAKMTSGKILKIPREDPLPWYDFVYKNTEYEPLTEIGLDINFNKHGVHGLELRFFDQMPIASIEIVLNGIILLADLSLKYKGPVDDPRVYKVWQDAAGQGLLYGKEWKLSNEQMITFCSVLKIKIPPPEGPLSVEVALQWLLAQLPRGGICWKKMVV